MSEHDLHGIDRELLESAGMQPVVDYSDPKSVRTTLRRGFRLARALRGAGPHDAALEVAERAVPTREGSPDVPARVYRPVRRADPAPALVFFHGGAFTAGDLETEDARCREIAARTGVVVVSVDYRLAPEHPYPAGFHDCYDALVWVAGAGAAELGIDPARVVVGGSSAGGALAAAVSQAARDLGGPAIALQVLLYPVADDRLETASMRAFTATPGWNQPNSVHMWRNYLRGWEGGAPSYAAPNRASDLTGLPPAYVMVADRDPLRDEGVEYARRLMSAGVSVELHQFAGAFHGFDAAAPQAGLSRRSLDEQCAVIARHTGVVVDEPVAVG
ncbi:alpha/beta hydrolase [Actinosynnema pretiosum]|nr:alpha/beta hydrolase [Actinosynnema pretiosum]